MLKQGVHPKVLQERLNNATISTTIGLYSHVTPELQEVAVAVFYKMVLSKREKEAVNNNYKQNY